MDVSKKSRTHFQRWSLNDRDEELAEPSSKKRIREDSEETPQLVDTAGKPSEADGKKLSKSEKKKLKKQKLQALAEGTTPAGPEKKVQFSPELEKGPTPSSSKPSEPAKPAISSQTKTEAKSAKKERITLENGVVIEDYKIGTGLRAKKGTKLGVRYIGKLVKGGKEFDKNTKGKPFRFVLGKGEVIKGENFCLACCFDC